MGRGWTGHGMRRGWLVRGREREAGNRLDWCAHSGEGDRGKFDRA